MSTMIYVVLAALTADLIIRLHWRRLAYDQTTWMVLVACVWFIVVCIAIWVCTGPTGGK